MGAPAPEAPPAAPGGGAIAGGGGQSAQLVQQIEGLLMQLAQSEPDPQIQHLIQQLSEPIQQLQQVVGKDDTEDMSSGLHNPGGEEAPGGAGGAAGGAPMPGGAGAGAGEGAGGEHHVVEVHIGVPSGGPKSFGDAKKAAMANFKEKGHFGSGPKGSPPETERAKNKAKG